MKINMMFSYFMLSLLILLFNFCPGQAMELPRVIDKTNCAQYKDLLVPAMYRAVEKGDFVISPGNINFQYKHPDSFIAAGNKNAGKFDISSEGDLIEKNTGKVPCYNIYGYPFPRIDLKDPKSGSRIMANYNFQRYRFMGTSALNYVLWIGTKGEERNIQLMSYSLSMNGRSPGHELINPDNILMYDLQKILEPMSIKGTNTMACIYMDQREDSNCSYVPAIRRIRQTTSTARSDPYMGSDTWLDISWGWRGKDRSMKWKYTGEKTILVPFTSPDTVPVDDVPDGRVTQRFPYSGRCFKLNYEVPGFKGAPWAPAPGVITYVPRKVWIVEQMPKDPYYSWGLHVNYIDQETYIIWYKEVYQKSGEFRTWASYFYHYSKSPSGKTNTGSGDAIIIIDEKVRHATVACGSACPESFIYIPASKLDPSFFSLNNFLLLSK